MRNHMSVNVIKTLLVLGIISVFSSPVFAIRDGEVNVLVIQNASAVPQYGVIDSYARQVLSKAYPNGYIFQGGCLELSYALIMANRFYHDNPNGSAENCFLYLRNMGVNDNCNAVFNMSDGRRLCGFVPFEDTGSIFMFDPVSNAAKAKNNKKTKSNTGNSNLIPLSGWNAGMTFSIRFY